MVRLLMIHTPGGESFLYTYGEDRLAEGEQVRWFVRRGKKKRRAD